MGREEAGEEKYIGEPQTRSWSHRANRFSSPREQSVVSNPELKISLMKLVKRLQDNQEQKMIHVKMEFLLTCSGSTWQNIDIFSFTDVSRGFAHLHTTW